MLRVKAGHMHAAGHLFYRSDNGVWLSDHVPAACVEFGTRGACLDLSAKSGARISLEPALLLRLSYCFDEFEDLLVESWMRHHLPADDLVRHAQMTTSSSMGWSRSTSMSAVSSLILRISSTGKGRAVARLSSSVARKAATAGSSIVSSDAAVATVLLPSRPPQRIRPDRLQQRGGPFARSSGAPAALWTDHAPPQQVRADNQLAAES